MMRSPLRRWTVRIALSLVFGALTTVGVSWGIAYTFDAGPNRYEGANIRSEGGLVLESHYVVVSHAFGFAVVESTRMRPDRMPASVYEDTDPVRLPSWAGDVGTPTKAFANQSIDREYRLLIATGWPMVALSSEMFKGTVAPSVFTVGMLEYRDGTIDSVVVPYHPIFPGFYLDTLIFALPWFGLLFGPGAMRTFIRRRRGRCPRCGYNLRGEFDDGCSECGWNRRSVE